LQAISLSILENHNFLIALGTVSVMVHALSSSVAQFSLLSLSFCFTEVAVLSVSHAVIVGFGSCNAFQEWKEILLANIDVINKSYYFLTVLNLIQHLIFYSADNAWGISQQLLPPFNLLYRYIVVRWPKAIFSSCRQSEQWGKSMVLMIK
jgi:hypothetical protein